MHIEKSGINLAAIYRPLNNKFLNFLMEKIRKNIFVKIKLKRVSPALKNYFLVSKELLNSFNGGSESFSKY